MGQTINVQNKLGEGVLSFGIEAIDGYLPQLRLDRRVVAKELAWAGLAMPRSGYRAVADWDEDSLTMAVEASRSLAEAAVTAVRFASTSAYFTDRSQSAMLIEALALAPSLRGTDHANSRRAGTSALFDSLLSGRSELVVASESRPTQAGSAAQFGYGDGAAAVRTGPDGMAKLIGQASLSHDFVDRYTSREHPTPYAYEERFVRDVAVSQLLVPAIRAACAEAGIDPSRIGHAACAEPVSASWKAAAKVLKVNAINHCETLVEQAGDLGAAQALFGLGLAFDAAAVGDIVLMVGFGSGADALLFEVTGPVPGAELMRAALTEGEVLTNYPRFLNLTGGIDLDWGMRAEFEQKVQATVVERVGRDMIGFVGGRDSLGNVQFPKSAYPVNPDLAEPEELEDVCLSAMEATIVSITADRLNFTPDPPFDFGLVQFDNGARVLMEMVNRPAAGFRVGDRIRMRLRIKAKNRRLGFRSYFWKAAPVVRPQLGEA